MNDPLPKTQDFSVMTNGMKAVADLFQITRQEINFIVQARLQYKMPNCTNLNHKFPSAMGHFQVYKFKYP